MQFNLFLGGVLIPKRVRIDALTLLLSAIEAFYFFVTLWFEICGIVNLIFNNEDNSFHNLEINCLPLFEVISKVILHLDTMLKYNL